MYTLHLSDLVIDEHGKAVYFDYGGLQGNKITPETGAGHDTTVSFSPGAPQQLSGQAFVLKKSGSPIEISKNMQQEIFQNVCNILDENHLFLPATQNGNSVISVDNSPGPQSSFKIKEHKLYGRKNFKDVALE